MISDISVLMIYHRAGTVEKKENKKKRMPTMSAVHDLAHKKQHTKTALKHTHKHINRHINRHNK